MEEVARLICQLGRRALVVPMDVADETSVQQGALQVLEEFGRVDLLVNSSGVGGPSKPLWEIGPQEWEDTFRVNVMGAYLVSRAFLPSMVAAGTGSVVFIGSVTGKRPLVNRTPYAASKMALVGLVRTLSTEAGAHGIRVNLISPGAVEGERLAWVLEQQAAARGISVEESRDAFASASPLHRLVTARDVARAVAFLGSSHAAAITGEDMNVNAGLAMY